MTDLEALVAQLRAQVETEKSAKEEVIEERDNIKKQKDQVGLRYRFKSYMTKYFVL